MKYKVQFHFVYQKVDIHRCCLDKAKIMLHKLCNIILIIYKDLTHLKYLQLSQQNTTTTTPTTEFIYDLTYYFKDKTKAISQKY